MATPAQDPVTGKFLPASQTIDPFAPVVDVTKIAPPEAPKAPEGEKKEEEVDLSGARALVDSFLGDKPSVPPEKKKAKTASKQKSDAKSEEKTEDKQKEQPKTPPKTKPQAPAPLTAADIAAAAAEGVARAMPKETKTESRTTAPDESWLTEDDKEKLTVLAEMEQLYGERYKGISEKYKQSKRSLIDYAKKWEADHPGEDFDESAEEHQAFFDKNEPVWDDAHYFRAAGRLEAKALLDQQTKETTAKLSVIERKEKLRELGPMIYAEQGKVAQRYWKLHGDDHAELVDSNGNFVAEKAKAIQDADPVAYGVRMQAARALDLESAELFKLMGLPGQNQPLVDFDEKNPIHKALAEFAMAEEDRMLKQPVAEQRDSQGRMFKPASDYFKLPTNDRKQFWTFSASDLAALRADYLANTAQKIIQQKEDEYRAWAKSRGLDIPDKPVKQNPKPQQEVEAESDEDDLKPRSPSGGGESKLAAKKSTAKPDALTGVRSFLSRGL